MCIVSMTVLAIRVVEGVQKFAGFVECFVKRITVLNSTHKSTIKSKHSIKWRRRGGTPLCGCNNYRHGCLIKGSIPASVTACLWHRRQCPLTQETIVTCRVTRLPTDSLLRFVLYSQPLSQATEAGGLCWLGDQCSAQHAWAVHERSNLNTVQTPRSFTSHSLIVDGWLGLNTLTTH